MKTKKQSAKDSQGYQIKPVFPMCINCAHFKSDIVKKSGYFNDWTREENLRCGIGGFAVKKTDTCRSHKPTA